MGNGSDKTGDERDSGAVGLLSAPVGSDTLERLHGRLERESDSAGLLDVAYRTLDTPLGELLLAATQRGLVRVAFATEDHDRVLQSLGASLGWRILRSPGRLDDAAREIEEYFDRRRRHFDLALDHSLSHGFRRTVQMHLPDIAYGQTRSYKEMAELVGNPKASRAVGTACATNPLPIVVPCHRVLRSDGTPGGYIGGLEAKAALLDLEAAA
ncbi:MAG: methylated-DNA--[protein]-cysteine S-methyltransferase [Microthrixaceae bacterium]